MAARLFITAQEIAQRFDPRDVARARTLQSAGCVREAYYDPMTHRVTALVRDTAEGALACRVEVELSEKHGLKRIESYGTCATGYMCAHGAAALFEAMAQTTRRHEGLSPKASDTKGARAPKGLSASFAAWVAETQAVQADAESEAQDERLAFLIDLGTGSPQRAPHLAPALQTRLEGRRWSAPRPLTMRQLTTLLRHNSNLAARSGGVLALLDSLHGGKDTGALFWTLPQDAELFDILFTRVLKSGVAFIAGEEDAQPYGLGPTVHAGLVWRLSADGRQSPSLAPEEPDLEPLVSVASPWYVNPFTRVMGRLSCGHEPEVLARFFAAPPVDARMVDPAREALNCLSLRLPLPCKVRPASASPQAPEARLILTQGVAADDDEARAYLSFRYGGRHGTLIAPHDPARQVAVREGEEMVLYPRDMKVEAVLLEQVAEAGLHPVVGVYATGVVQSFMPAPGASPWFWLDFRYLGLPRLAEAGVEVIDHTPTAKALVKPDTTDIEAAFTEKGGWWFSLDLGVSVEGKRVKLLPILVELLKEIRTPADIDALPESGTFFAPLPDGRRLALPAARVRVLLKTLVELFDAKALDEDGSLRIPLDLTAAVLKLETITRKRWIGGGSLRKLAEKLADFDGVRSHALPRGLAATLRPYQVDGFNWLHFLGQYGLSGILADDMGLGKTVQTLAFILAQKEKGKLEGPCLIVMPTSLIANWQAEIARFTPGLSVLTLHGKDRARVRGAIAAHDLVLTTYPLLVRDGEALSKTTWALIVLDEAQAIKNPSAKVTQNACALPARQRVCLTGTPVENHLGEAWSLFTFLMPGLLGDHRGFVKHYRAPIEKGGDTERQALFASRLKPFVLRRLKAEVERDLPPKTEIIRRVTLGETQQDLYEIVRHVMNDRVREEIAAKGLARSHIVILDALLKLRQTCCDPRLVKLEAAKAATESAKLAELMEMLPTLIEEGRRVLLFSQFTSMLDLIKPELKKADIPFVELRGSTKDRATPVKSFQSGAVPLFLISLKAGGTGLNLTAADTVIHYDPWWNPAVENQATDRAHRIGQTKPVFVYKLIAKDTVEERILDLQTRKAGLAKALFAGEGGGASGALTPDDLKWLMGE